ncbi:MAG: hypothetical protein U9R48_02425 [Chloroflexota bacterium]|nr:hypothetical protein [Chloroflexota bacterium]
MSVASHQEPEVVVYRRVQRWSVYLGLALLLVTFIIYVSGLMKPYIAPTELDEFWSLSVHEYIETAEIETGWGWLSMLRYADFLNFVGVAFLASVPIICYIAIIPVLLRDRKTIYAVLAVLEVIVLAVAASGILGVV